MRNALLIFVLPPSAVELARRLSARASEDPMERRKRLTNAMREIEAAPEFDFVVLNDDLERAYERIAAIVQGIVRSDAFLKQGSAATHQPAGTQVAARR